MLLHPLKFHPILKEKIWGGDKLGTLLNKPTDEENIGESWEISTVGDDISVISNGELCGKNLVDLIKEYKTELLGEKVYQRFGNQFPLLIKFIDAKEDLSVQLHPNDELAKTRHNSFGKTEMWYVIQADKGTKLIIGFNRNTSKEEYEKFLKEERITELLNFEDISKGDSYFINAGKIHAIGGGALIAEIQQTSNITYRVFDWNRKDSKGNLRELHTDLALDALEYEIKNDFKLDFDKRKNISNRLVHCNYFTTNFLEIKNKIFKDYSGLDSFVVIMCIEGEGELISDSYSNSIVMGETIMIPANFKEISFKSDFMKLLEVYIGDL